MYEKEHVICLSLAYFVYHDLLVLANDIISFFIMADPNSAAYKKKESSSPTSTFPDEVK